MRRFEEVNSEYLKFPDVPTQLPERATRKSAGYDLRAKEDYTLVPGESHVFWTDVKAVMYFDNVFNLYTRSGNGIKGVTLRNNVGVIDADYAENPKTGGNIGVCLYNTGINDFRVKVGDRIAQGIFSRYLITDDDKYLNSEYSDEGARTGGFGSTGA